MTIHDLSERECPNCDKTINVCLEIREYDDAIPMVSEKIKYTCTGCNTEVEDKVDRVGDNLPSVPEGFIKATLVREDV